MTSLFSHSFCNRLVKYFLFRFTFNLHSMKIVDDCDFSYHFYTDHNHKLWAEIWLTFADFDFSNCCICSMVGACATESIGKSHTLLLSHAVEKDTMWHITTAITWYFIWRGNRLCRTFQGETHCLEQLAGGLVCRKPERTSSAFPTQNQNLVQTGTG